MALTARHRTRHLPAPIARAPATGSTVHRAPAPHTYRLRPTAQRVGYFQFQLPRRTTHRARHTYTYGHMPMRKMCVQCLGSLVSRPPANHLEYTPRHDLSSTRFPLAQPESENTTSRASICSLNPPHNDDSTHATTCTSSSVHLPKGSAAGKHRSHHRLGHAISHPLRRPA